jgi:hypothetical protein
MVKIKKPSLRTGQHIYYYAQLGIVREEERQNEEV